LIDLWSEHLAKIREDSQSFRQVFQHQFDDSKGSRNRSGKEEVMRQRSKKLENEPYRTRSNISKKNLRGLTFGQECVKNLMVKILLSSSQTGSYFLPPMNRDRQSIRK
jgi:hypothetical protein